LTGRGGDGDDAPEENVGDIMARIKFAAAGCGLALGVALAFAAHAEPLKIRLGWIGAPGSWGPAIAEKQDLAQHVGKSYTLELTRLAGTSPMVTALAAGELDIAPLSFSAFGLAVENGGLDDLRVIADEIEDGKDGYYTTEFLVKKGGPIKTIEDLKGKTLATNAIGGATDMAMRVMLRRAHLEEKKDYTIVETQLGNMKAFLIEGKADLIAPSPNFVDAELRGLSRPLFTQKDAFGVTQFTAWYTRQEFIAKNRAALVDFLEDYVREIRWWLDPKNHDEAVQIMARITKIPAERIAWAYTTGDWYHDPDGLPNLDALQHNLQLQKELGFLKGDIDVRRHADLSLVREAAARVK
jgi:sulfonate transport system substrate-binding protein